MRVLITLILFLLTFNVVFASACPNAAGITIVPTEETQAVASADLKAPPQAYNVTKSKPASVSIPQISGDIRKLKGIVLSGGKNKSEPRFNTYMVKLEDGQEIRIDTARNLSARIGKPVNLEIQGSLRNFVLKNVTFAGQVLPQTGPNIMLGIIGFFAMIVTFFISIKNKAFSFIKV